MDEVPTAAAAAPVTDPEEAPSDPGRVLALSDGVFAFAMTLLVINLVVPSAAALPGGAGTNGRLAAYLLDDRTAFFAYGLAFFIIGTWWSAHLRLFRVLARYDRRVITLNLVFLLFIAITPFDVGLLAAFGGTAVGVGFYAATQALAGGVLLVLWVYVGGHRESLARSTSTADSLRQGTLLAAIPPLGFAVSVPVALVSPYAAIGVWFALFVARFAWTRWPRGPVAATAARSTPPPAGGADAHEGGAPRGLIRR